MKKNFLALSAIVLAIVFSSFTVTETVDVYEVYDGTGDQTVRTNYSEQSTSPGTDNNTIELWWFKIVDDNGTVTDTEFATAFSNYDLSSDNSLDDESEISGSLELRNDVN